MAFAIGSVVADYRIERIVGVGGMGTVYLAQHLSMSRRDALKVLSSELSRDRQFRARFLREAELAATLDHPNIVTVYDRGETADGQLWIAMEFIDGTDASAELDDGKITAPRAVHIVTEVAKALDYAHSRDLLHRDIKPANFLVAGSAGGQERVWLADFGIARALDDTTHLTGTGLLVGTAAYTPPEAIEGKPLDHRADIYSLGCSLFRLLTGRTPYPQSGPMSASIMAHIIAPIPRATHVAPWLPPAIDDVFFRALAKDPAHRFHSAGALAAAAAAAFDAQRGLPRDNQTSDWLRPPERPVSPVHANPAHQHRVPPGVPQTPHAPAGFVGGPPPGWLPPPPRRRGRRRWMIGAAAIAVVAATATAVALVAHPGKKTASDPAPQATVAPPPPAASAADTGPVSLIFIDPTCARWREISEAYTVNSPLEKLKPDSPDNPINVPASAWTPDQKQIMQRFAGVLRDLTGQTVVLVSATPHRVMAELYEQVIAYQRAFVDSFGSYFPQVDLKLGKAGEDAFNALVNICNAVTDGAAKDRSTLVSPAAPPHQAPAPLNPANPTRFIRSSDKSTCAEWTAFNQKYDTDPVINAFDKTNHLLPVDKWSPEQKAATDAAAPVIRSAADDLERIGGRSDNPLFADFAALTALYERTLVAAFPTYVGAYDQNFGMTGGNVRRMLSEACGAIGA